MRAATREVSLLARCATASMSTAVAGPSRSSTARHFSFLSTQSSGAGFSGRRFETSAPGSQPLSCGCCGRKPVSFPATSQLRVASYSTRAPSGGRALMTSAAEQAPARSSPASAPATEASASHSSYQPPELAITNPISSPKGGPSRGPFRGADLKDPSTASRQDSIELEDTLPSTLPQEQTGACSTLSPSSPSAPRSQRSSAESSAATVAQESASASAAAPPIASTPKRGGGAAFRPKKAALTLSPEAISRLRGLSEAPGGPKLIRIGVRNKGCAGMSYHLEYVTPEQAGKFDEKVQQDGVTVLIESKALFSIIGSEMDWQDDRLSSKFIFNNPNVKEACGCGESFLT